MQLQFFGSNRSFLECCQMANAYLFGCFMRLRCGMFVMCRSFAEIEQVLAILPSTVWLLFVQVISRQLPAYVIG